jgi:hypothetical protein
MLFNVFARISHIEEGTFGDVNAKNVFLLALKIY